MSPKDSGKSMGDAGDSLPAEAGVRIESLPRERAPYELLLMADPERGALEAYLSRSELFAAYPAGDDSRPRSDFDSGPEFDSRAIVGVLALAPGEQADEVEIKNIAVKPEYRGRGIGRALLKFAIQQALRRSRRAIEIGTGNSSLDQLALYQKAGFRMHRILPDFFVKNYKEKIYENGIQCRDMVILRREL